MANKQVQHVNITSAHCHESKGVDTASSNSAYVADGAGSGSWEVLPQLLKSSAYPVGFIKPFAGAVAPIGWFLCDGSLISRITYGRLFATIGTFFGIGDGATTFALPDCRGRLLVGRDNMGEAAGRITIAGSGINGEVVGSTGGTETVALTHDNFPSFEAVTNTTGAHTHTSGPSSLRRNASGSGGGNNLGASGSAGSLITFTAQSAGEHTHTYTVNAGSPNTPHNNVQPSIIMNMIIYHGVA